ncbi:metallophosphoesterase family protein [Limosilactobacillus sp. STM2_1]|uniref:Metallophosphoesterase family protein n=1 Tax=Limosilactobacillus rudii TaxID=2759755 RepID=A0A7W3YM81_9LACO|nr:metallophosphoesterase family protein [Limosilactobacillus rudii]MBB1080268.1 metallophosphoesterase family protein [Limosilactobacillus rudii]MBB1096828.1 metallophosphoesterase family protein [Limosilactobacillus rudii]MCD7133725.1 metallophosphatase family protein [Limosilactobacillus rudii]
MRKRIAVFSDIHGNLSALQAMYQDSIKQHAEEYWFIGDLLMPGPSVEAIWDIFQKMNPTVVVRGNWDDLVVRGARGMMDMERPSHIYFARLAQYVAEHVSPTVINTIASWPLHVTKRVGALNFGVSHNLPWLNMGQALFPTQETANFDKLFNIAGEPVDVAIYAHVHHDLLRYASDERVILNPGAVGEPFNHWQPLQRDLRAHYLMLEVDETGLAETSFRHVSYNREREKEIAAQSDVPYKELYQKMMVTGRAYTHDDELLTKYNKQFNYADEYRNYAKKINS